METKQQVIETFSKIRTSTFGDDGQKKEYQSDDLLTTIIYGLEALSGFALNCDYDAAHTMGAIRDKFDPKENIGRDVHALMDTVNTMIIQANRYGWDFAKIAQTLKKYVG